MKFIFDLDGTITANETLPVIAKHFHLEEEIRTLTKETIKGNIPFVESFIRRCHLLGRLPVHEIARLMASVNLNEKVISFIKTHKTDCVIVTDNLFVWVEKLVENMGCTCFTSKAKIENNKVLAITKIISKEEVVKRYQANGEEVVFIGAGNNDIEAMRIADVAIATGLVHYPSKSILPFADYLIFDENALCRQLHQLL